jgi:hypothetical protein
MILSSGAPISFVAPLSFLTLFMTRAAPGKTQRIGTPMIEEVHVRFDTGGVSDPAEKVRAALTDVSLVPELDPDESENGVRVLIFKGSWDAVDQQALRSALQAKELPGSFAIEATSSHGYV